MANPEVPGPDSAELRKLTDEEFVERECGPGWHKQPGAMYIHGRNADVEVTFWSREGSRQVRMLTKGLPKGSVPREEFAFLRS